MAEVLIAIRIEPLEEGGYLATSEEIQGLVAQGRTVAETMEIAQDVARKLIDSCVEHGDRLPAKVAGALRRPHRGLTLRIPVGVKVKDDV